MRRNGGTSTRAREQLQQVEERLAAWWRCPGSPPPTAAGRGRRRVRPERGRQAAERGTVQPVHVPDDDRVGTRRRESGGRSASQSGIGRRVASPRAPRTVRPAAGAAVRRAARRACRHRPRPPRRATRRTGRPAPPPGRRAATAGRYPPGREAAAGGSHVVRHRVAAPGPVEPTCATTPAGRSPLPHERQYIRAVAPRAARRACAPWCPRVMRSRSPARAAPPGRRD